MCKSSEPRHINPTASGWKGLYSLCSLPTLIMIEQREGKEARLKELNMHLSLAYRYWQKGKPHLVGSELATASHVLSTMTDYIVEREKVEAVKGHLAAAKTAVQNNDGETVTGELSRALAVSEKMLRLMKR